MLKISNYCTALATLRPLLLSVNKPKNRSGMKPRLYLYLILAEGCALSSCSTVQQQAYYVSPINGHPNDYQPLPQTIDSAHTAVYAHAAFLNGGANQDRTDGVKAFRTSVTVAHHSGILQAYYGADLTLGTYHLGKWDTFYKVPLLRAIPPANMAFLNSQSGNRSFGGVGFKGGANLVWSFPRWEWRYIGMETSMHQEFGEYLSFRKKLPDTAATLNIRNPFFATLGFSTEIVRRTWHGEWGFRFATGWALGDAYRNTEVYDFESGKKLKYWYGNFSFHYTYERYTGYLQLNGATQARSLNIGVHYRFTRPRNDTEAQYPRHRHYRKRNWFQE